MARVVISFCAVLFLLGCQTPVEMARSAEAVRAKKVSRVDVSEWVATRNGQCHELRRNVCLVTDSVPARELARLADHAQKSIDDVAGFLNADPPSALPVFVLERTDEKHPVTRTKIRKEWRNDVLVRDEKQVFVVVPYEATGDADLNVSITHEITHAIASERFQYTEENKNWLLVEGLAVYMQVKFGAPRKVASKSQIDLDIVPKALILNGKITPGIVHFLSEREKLFRDREPIETELQVTMDYLVAGSFVKFLIENFGVDKFKEVYVSTSFPAVYGKSIRDLELDWLVALFAK